uniref:RRM domain-containing protein n=1 Tax=Meloidogyne incognita TaxID=6306 RepID=A0A914MAD6_MELIC
MRNLKMRKRREKKMKKRGEDEENEGMSKIKEEGDAEGVDEDEEEEEGEGEEDELKDGEEDGLEGEEDDLEEEEEEDLEDEDNVSDKNSTKGEFIKLTGIKNEDQISEDDEMESDNPSEEDEENETKKTSRRENVKMRRADIKASESRTVFVGNAPVKTQQRELRKLFKSFGEIEAVYQRTHLQMTEKLTKMMVSKYPEIEERLTSTNFYIRYVKDEQAENAARAMNGTKLNGHVLRVTVGAKKEVDHRRSIFVGNIPHTTLDESVRAYFSTCGKISALRLLRDKQTGLVRGSGFIEFVDSDSIQKALELNNLPFEGRKLRISKVYKKNKTNQFEPIFLTCGKISALRLLRDKQTGLVRGSGFIEFVDSDSIQKALELNNLPFEGRKLRISKVYKKNKLEKITIKNEKKRENLKRKLPKVPKGAEK